MVTTTMNSLLDQAIEAMGPLRKRVYTRLMNDPTLKANVVDHLALSSMSLACCSECAGAFNKDDFTGEMTLAINPDNLKKWLDWIIANLPSIIALILKLMSL